ncbi:MAG: RNA methyltransferase [Proteobacteria bacterium]|nr:RNA methyltransferase [Pseudomonadota bacterium]
MSGTDTSRETPNDGPVVILVDPQLGENIGMVARAMLNCGLEELRLVRPRDGWPNSAAESAASGADSVLEKTRLFDTTAEAVADLSRVYAATARPRGMITPVVTPRQAAAELRAAQATGTRAGVIFGPERSGLVNDDVALADAVLSVPLNPAFASLNLAQAVFVVGYEWLLAETETPARELPLGAARPATKAELLGFFERLEAALDAAGFLQPVEKRPNMVRNLRNLFQRAELSGQEVRTLHGIVTALTARRGRDGGSDEGA